MPKQDAVKRQAARVGAEYLLRSLVVLRDASGGDLLSTVILLGVMQANVAHVDDIDAGRHQAQIGPPPDSARRPISVLALAQSLGLPYETTRRTVGNLISAGRLERTRTGVIVPARLLRDEAWMRALDANWSNLKRVMMRVERAGLDAQLRSKDR